MQITLLKKPFAVSLSGNPMPFSFVIAPYSTGAAKQNYTVLLRILVEDSSGSGFFTEVHQQTFYPNSVGQINIDIQSQIDPYLTWYTPRLSTAKMLVATGQYKNYQVAYSLLLDGVAIAPETLSPVLSAIKGGMAKEEWHPTEWVSNYLQAQHNFLGYQTGREKTFPEAASFLFFMAPANDTFTCTASLIDDAGQPYLLTLPNTLYLTQYGVACLPSGYEQLGLHALLPAGSFGIQYTVIINGAVSGLVARRTFKLDYRNFYNPATICYRNSLGGLETVVLRGEVDFEADYDNQQAQHISPPSYFQNNIFIAEQEQITTETAKYSGDTGFNDRETTSNFRDFFTSKQRFEIRNGKLFPIYLLNKNIKFFGNRDNLISIQLQWQSTYTNEYFTPAGVMPATRSCPALESIQITQVNKSTLQIMWAAPVPYDAVQVSIIIGANTYVYNYSGNTGSILQPFINPAAVGGTANIVIQGRVVCDANALPTPDLGPASIVSMQVIGNSLPVLANDTFIVASGLTAATNMPNSVLDNDYDPDGDTLVAVAATGLTNAGGTYSIDVAGKVTYKPPTASYNGLDYVDYQANDGSGTNVTARIYFKVGGSVNGVIFMKAYTKNTSTTSPAADVKQTIGEYWIGAFSDAAAQNPLDVTGLGLVVNYNHNTTYGAPSTNPNTSVAGSVPMTGTAVKIYQGLILQQLFILVNGGSVDMTITFPVQAGNGYVAL